MATILSNHHSVHAPDAPSSNLCAATIAELRRLRDRPAIAPRLYHVAHCDVDEVAKETLDTMLVRAYRVAPLPPPDEYAHLLSRVRHWVKRGQPIRVMLGYAPMKNPRTTPHTHADWAEFFALCHLCSWHNKVSSVYPPGLRIKIIFDDSTIRMANRYARTPMIDYMRSVGRLIRAMEYDSFIVGTLRQSMFAWLFHLGPYQVAERRVRRWEQDPANAEAMARMLEFARRNLLPPADMSDDQQERLYQDAAHRYRVYWQALQLSGLSRLGRKLVAMYLDGNQHHLRQSATLHLTSLGKGQVAQPWQGEGALCDNGHGKLIPTVLTSKRREELQARRIGLPTFLSCPGFTSICICHQGAATARVGQARVNVDVAETRPRTD